MGKYKLQYWKSIEGYDRYEVSISGEIRSKEYRHSGKPHLLKPFKMHRNRDNYLAVNLWKDGKQGKPIPVHRIVALAFPEFCGEWFDGAVINHKDENPENNSAFNLETCTVAYNNSYGTARQREWETKVANGLYHGIHIGTPEFKEYWNRYRREQKSRPQRSGTFKG